MTAESETATIPTSRTDTRSRSPGGDEPFACHAVSADECLRRLDTQSEGLTSAEAARRLATFGRNRLPISKPRSALLRFAAQFHNLLIYVLVAAGVLAALLGHVVDAAVIFAVVLLNAAIGFVQEGRAERALDAIRAMITAHASVLRDGNRTTVSAEDVVPGDIVLMDAGDRVPADMRVIRARNLTIEEAILTGESVAVEKGTAPVDAKATLGDRSSMAFSGTFVAAGQGVGVVVATGLSTELGRISAMLGAVETLTTPLVRQMDQFARQLTAVILAVSVAVFVFAVYLRDYAWADAFMAMVGLAVAAIPEGLPAVMTITLAIGVQRMAARNAIIRRLPAVETLGSVSVICSDKTGTLTRNEMMVQTIVTAAGTVEVAGSGYEPRGEIVRDGRSIDAMDDPVLNEIGRAALLCNDATLRQAGAGWMVDGDPMEGAFVSFGAKAGYDVALTRKQYPRTDEIPFDARHRFMATLHHGHDGKAVLYMKGAPETVIGMCATALGAQGTAPIDPVHWHARIDALASRGQRVLALAMKAMPEGSRDLTFKDVEDNLVLLGIAGLIDPPREEAIAAIGECVDAGIAVKVITGDHAVTAGAIAGQLGLPNHRAVMTGDMLEALDEPRFREAARSTTVFARATPEQKLRLVEALQADGAVVAMTGDGVNDAPALKRADVGIAMGRKGTEAAKEAAEIVLADDNFASIVAAVREGRTVYDNLTKVIGWTLPTNGGESMAIITAILFGLALPITPVQILWINMVTAVALGLTLAFEPTEPDAMRRSPRAPDRPILSGLLIWRVVLVSLLFVIGAFGMFFWAEARGLAVEEARTIVVNTIVVMEIFYLFSVRYLHGTSLTWTGVVGTPAVLVGVGTVIAAQFVFTYAPFMHVVFATRPVSWADGANIVILGIVFFAILELDKLVRRRLRLLAD
jgi:magnesium-transporting ATPase (P-type)